MVEHGGFFQQAVGGEGGVAVGDFGCVFEGFDGFVEFVEVNVAVAFEGFACAGNDFVVAVVVFEQREGRLMWCGLDWVEGGGK